MWFKNLQLYRFTKPFELDAETLGQQLEQHGFVPCGSQDSTRSGWVPPLGRHSSEFVHVTNGYLMICSKRQDKLLPAAVINEALEEKVMQIEEREARNMPRKERSSLRDEVVFSLLPKAFVRSSLQFAYISPRDNMLVVNAASAKRAEELLQDLRDALGSLSVIPLLSKHQPIEVMTQWVNSGQPAQGFELGEECELRDNADISCVIRCKNQDLATAEIVNHLKTGMHVSKLALNWQQRIECVLDEKLIIKRLRFSDMLQEQANEVEADDAAARFDVDFSIMALELSAFIKALVSAFGGEQPTESASATGTS
ncbi:MAG: recombination-associated protein RdgC [Gammaproteobacteria bacterium]|nr:recombination-associated protein RdgC [Gammaproteobacteria bacterium]